MITRFGSLAIVGVLCLSAHASTHYYANAGADSNAGTSTSAPRQTITQLNLDIQNPAAGDVFLLNRGDFFRDASIYCGSKYQNSGSQTITNNPPKCSGGNGNPIIIGAYGTGNDPVVDSADVLPQVWTLVSGQTTTWTQHVSQLPLKLYVDPPAVPTKANAQQALLPAFNDRGTCSISTAPIHYLDKVEVSSGALYANLLPTDIGGNSDCYTGGGQTLQPLHTASSTDAIQGFAADGLTGLQGVEQGVAAYAPGMNGFGYPTYQGIFYAAVNSGGGYDVWVNLTDGSSPNTHVIEATHRTYGIQIEGANNVTVQDIIFVHSFMGCAVVDPFSDTDAVGENISFIRVIAANCSSYGTDRITKQNSGGYGFFDRGGIIFNVSGANVPLLLQNPYVGNSFCGTVDSLFADPTGDAACIYLDGFTTARGQMVAYGNTVSPTNTPGILVGNSAGVCSVEGRISGNEVTNAQQLVGFSNVCGGRLDNNNIHDGYGEGVQAGGFSSSVDNGTSGPGVGSQQLDHNVIMNIGLGANHNLYNGIDGNTSGSLTGVYEFNNTIVNVWGHCQTFENANASDPTGTSHGMNSSHSYNNVCDQNHPYFGNGLQSTSWTQSTQTGNGSGILYFAQGQNVGMDLHNNFYKLLTGISAVTGINSGSGITPYTCAQWKALDTETGTICDGTDPGFTSYATENVSPLSSSALRGAGVSGLDVGALAYVAATSNWIIQGIAGFQGYVSR